MLPTLGPSLWCQVPVFSTALLLCNKLDQIKTNWLGSSGCGAVVPQSASGSGMLFACCNNCSGGISTKRICQAFDGADKGITGGIIFPKSWVVWSGPLFWKDCPGYFVMTHWKVVRGEMKQQGGGGVKVREGGGRNERESRGTHTKLVIAPPLCSACLHTSILVLRTLMILKPPVYM